MMDSQAHVPWLLVKHMLDYKDRHRDSMSTDASVVVGRNPERGGQYLLELESQMTCTH